MKSKKMMPKGKKDMPMMKGKKDMPMMMKKKMMKRKSLPLA